MKKITKRMLIIFLSMAMVLTLFGCGNSTASSSTASDKKATIGVILYSFSDTQGQCIKSYCSYLEKHFNVKFKYADLHNDDSLQISTLENLISSGVNAVISGYTTSLPRCLKICEENKVYYSVALSDVVDKNDLKAAQESKYFVGGIRQFSKNPSKLGASYADAAYKAGLKNIGVSSFYFQAFLDAPTIIKGFTDEIAALDAKNGTKTTVYAPLQHKFFGFNSELTTYITSNPNMDGLFALGSGMDSVYPVMKNIGKTGKIKLLCLGYNNSSKAAIQDGSLVMGGNNNFTQNIATCFAQLYDRVNGNSYKDWQVNGDTDYPTFATASALEDYETYGLASKNMNKGPVTADELKKVMKTYNKKATWADLEKLVTRTIPSIKAARK